ncbi:MAG: type I phosphomannose isomerase catalytic subunit [Bacteroidales bacterium]
MTELYPLKFEPILKEKVWGGRKLNTEYGKKPDVGKNIGESWELSGVQDDISVISNGFLAGNNLEEVIEVYMGDITGDEVYEKYGNEFPLLIKFIEANEDLSIQVHPSDEMAKERHNAYGKTEMWYILQGKKGAKIYTGFREPCDKEQYIDAVSSSNLPDILNVEYAIPGDVFFTPAGRIHAIGAGTTLVEVQQTSDITYRIFDWNRGQNGGEKRELHTELALDAIDYSAAGPCKISPEIIQDKTINLVTCDYFVTNLLSFGSMMRKDYNLVDSFIIYVCLEGSFQLVWDGGAESMTKGETVLVPATIRDVTLEPRPEARLLEIFIRNSSNNQ